MICPKCGSEAIFIQAVTNTKTKHRGCIRWFFVDTFGYMYFGDYTDNSPHNKYQD